LFLLILSKYLIIFRDQKCIILRKIFPKKGSSQCSP